MSAGRSRTRSNGASQEGSLRQTAGGGADGRGAWWQRFTSKLPGRFKRQTFSLSPALDTMAVDKNVFPRSGRVCEGVVVVVVAVSSERRLCSTHMLHTVA